MLSLTDKHLLSIYSVPEGTTNQGRESKQPLPQIVEVQSADTQPAAVGQAPPGSVPAGDDTRLHVDTF